MSAHSSPIAATTWFPIPQFPCTLVTASEPLPESDYALVKVLHVINGEHFSGAERVQQLLGKQLARFSVEAQFACVKPVRFPEVCGLRAGQVSQFPMKSRWQRIAGVASRPGYADSRPWMACGGESGMDA